MILRTEMGSVRRSGSCRRGPAGVIIIARARVGLPPGAALRAHGADACVARSPPWLVAAPVTDA